MFKIKALKEERLKIVTELDALAKVMVEESRDLTEDEKKDWNEKEARSAEIDSIIVRLKSQEERSRYLSESETKPTQIEVIREERHNEEGEYRGFSSLGDQLGAVARSMTPGNASDPRLLELRAASGSGESVGADGGFGVQSDFATDLFNKVVSESTLASQCTTIPLSANSNELVLTLVDESSRATGSRFGGVRGYWRAEGGTVSATKPKLREERIKAEALEALWYASEELLEDSTAMTTIASLAFTQELSWLLDDAIVRGDGAGKPLGILNSGALIAPTRTTANVFKFEDADNMVDRMYVGGRGNAKWYAHADLPQQLRNAVKVSGANSDFLMYSPPGGISGAQYDTLYGKDVKVIEQASALATVGDVLYADMSQYLLVRKGGVKSAQSAHVRFIYSEMAFKWTMRVNGQPLWNTPLTDAYGSTTRSPFVSCTTLTS